MAKNRKAAATATAAPPDDRPKSHRRCGLCHHPATIAPILGGRRGGMEVICAMQPAERACARANRLTPAEGRHHATRHRADPIDR